MIPTNKKRPLESISAVNLQTYRKQQSIPANGSTKPMEKPSEQSFNFHAQPTGAINKKRKMENPRKISFQSFKMRKNLKNGGNSPYKPVQSENTRRGVNEEDEQVNSILEISQSNQPLGPNMSAEEGVVLPMLRPDVTQHSLMSHV